MTEENQAFSQTISCIYSGVDYTSNSKSVFDLISTNSGVFINDFLNAITQILLGLEYSPTQKFYALLLLVQTTETRNLNLINKVAAKKDMLNKIFLDAQFDKNKPYTEKGKAFFSKHPSKEESRIGNNYVRLVLEALKFWSDSFGSSNKADPNYIYTMMSTVLSSRLAFPESFKYIGKTLNITADFHMKGEVKPREMRTLVYKTIASDKSFQDHFRDIESIFESKREEHIQSFLTVILEVLETVNMEPFSKILCLYLLVKISETKNELLIQLLARSQDLINKIFQDGQFDSEKSLQEKGLQYFSNNPTPQERIYGHNYVILALEALTFWSQEYGSSNKEDIGYIFTMMYSALLKSKIELPQPLQFVKIPLATAVANLEKQLTHENAVQLKDSPTFATQQPLPRVETEIQNQQTEKIETNSIISTTVKDDNIEVQNKEQKSPLQARRSSFEGFIQNYNTSQSLSASAPRQRKLSVSEKFKQIFPEASRSVRKMTPDRRLDASLRDIETNISLSRQRSIDASMTMEKDASHLSKLKRPPTYKPMDVFKKKEKLETEITQLMKERSSLQKENIQNAQTVRSSVTTERNEVRMSARTEGYAKSRRGSQVLSEYMQKQGRDSVSVIEKLKEETVDLQYRLDSARKELEEKTNELEALKKRNVPLPNKIVGIINENAELKVKFSKLERETRSHSSLRSSYITEHAPSERASARGTVGSKTYNAYLIPSGNKDQYSHRPSYTQDFARSNEKVNLSRGSDVKLDSKTMPLPEPVQQNEPINTRRTLVFESEEKKFIEEIENDIDLSEWNSTKEIEPTQLAGQKIELMNSFLIKLKSDLKISFSTADVINFKLACLKNKGLLCDNDFMQVQVTSHLMTDATKQQKYVKLILFYKNKGPMPIEKLSVLVEDGSTLSISTRNNLKDVTMQSNQIITQQITLLIQDIPYEFPSTTGEAQVLGQAKKLSFYLPCLITKFMEFKYITAQDFESKWQAKAHNILRTDQIPLDQNIVASGYDLHNFFLYLVDLKSKDEYDFIQGKKNIDLGGVFQLDMPGVEYLLRISIFPSNHVIFQIAAEAKERDVANFILETLVLLFKPIS